MNVLFVLDFFCVGCITYLVLFVSLQNDTIHHSFALPGSIFIISEK